VQSPEDLLEEDSANCCDKKRRQEVDILAARDYTTYAKIRSDSKQSTARSTNNWLDDEKGPTCQVVRRRPFGMPSNFHMKHVQGPGRSPEKASYEAENKLFS
jgi:hypothetical protein